MEAAQGSHSWQWGKEWRLSPACPTLVPSPACWGSSAGRVLRLATTVDCCSNTAACLLAAAEGDKATIARALGFAERGVELLAAELRQSHRQSAAPGRESQAPISALTASPGNEWLFAMAAKALVVLGDCLVQSALLPQAAAAYQSSLDVQSKLTALAQESPAAGAILPEMQYLRSALTGMTYCRCRRCCCC